MPAGHEQADGVAGGLGPVERADEVAAVDHADAVGEGEDLVELGGHQQHGGALVADLDDAAVDELDRADVEPTGRLGDDEELHVAGELPGDDHLLLVAAREGVDRRRSVLGVRTSNSLHERLGVALDGLVVAQAPAGERRPSVAVEHEVVGDRERAHDPVLAAVLGHVARRRAR